MTTKINSTINRGLDILNELVQMTFISCDVSDFFGIYSTRKCHGCTLVINQSYWFEILQIIIKSLEGWGRVIIFLLLALTLVFSVSVSSVYKSLLRGSMHGIFTWSIYMPFLF